MHDVCFVLCHRVIIGPAVIEPTMVTRKSQLLALPERMGLATLSNETGLRTPLIRPEKGI